MLLLLFCIPFIYFFFNWLKNKINYYYFFKFVLLNSIAFIYNLFYSILYIIYFMLKYFKFYRFYNVIGFKATKFFYNKKSVYFFFWKYLTIYVITYIYQVFLVFVFSIYLNFKNIYIYNIIFIILKVRFLTLYEKIILSKTILSKAYRLIIIFYYHIFKFINVDLWYFLLKKFNVFKKLQYVEDPLLYRNFYIKLSFINFFFYNILVYKKFLINIKFYFNIYLKKKILIHLVDLIYYFNLFIFIKISKLQEFLWDILFVNLKKKKIKFLKFYVILLFFFKILYILLSFIILFINIIIYNIYKYKYIVLYILLFILCIKYYWLIYYYFILLFKHYILYLPIIDVKEASRFFNFEWIDLRNYYNLMLLHNNLIDLTYLNNIIYNDMLVYLNNILSLYGFVITTQYNIKLNSLFLYVNNDTALLHNLLNVYNNSLHYKLLMWYDYIARYYSNKLKFTLKMLGRPEEDYYIKPLRHTLENKYKKLKKSINKGLLHPSYVTIPIEYTKNHKENVRLWSFFNKEYNSNLLLMRTTSVSSHRILKLKYIPLRYIPFFYKNTYFVYVFNNLKRTHGIYMEYKFLLGVQRKIGYFFAFLKKKVIKINYLFFFSTTYNYKDYKNVFNYKYKIPNLNWSLVRRKKRIISNYLIDYIFINGGAVSETHPVESYQDTAIKKLFKKRVYDYVYLYEFYPYNINNNSLNNNANIIKCLNYFDIFNKNIKIIKKYHFILNSKIFQNKKKYTILLENYKWLTKLIKSRMLKIEKNLKYFNFKKKEGYYNFWYFFNNIKVNKYAQDDEGNFFISLFLVKSCRKDYIKFRNTLLRFSGLYNYHYLLEYTQIKGHWPEFRAYLQNRYLQYNFENLKLNWSYKTYLTNTRKNGKALHGFSYLIELFKKNFIYYYIMCDYTINSYNSIFNNNVDVYKLNTLNKINNLKRFFFFKSKKNFGWAIFNYLNCFSLKFHLKHLLLHSPYSFLFYKNEYLLNIDDLHNIKSKEIKYYLKYIYINKHKEYQSISLIKYSFVFNLFINLANIKSTWYKLFIIDNIVLNNNLAIENTFINFYNFNYLELYRILISLIFSYYNNFIYRIERFGYILKHKNYTILTFFKRYFNVYIYYYFRQISIKVRWQVYRYAQFSSFCKKHYGKWFSVYNFYKGRIKCTEFLPLWFYYDFYIKAFIYFLLKKYYVKSFFVIYWLYIKFSYKFIFNLIIICYYIFLYNVLNYLNFIKINFIILSLYLLNWFYMHSYIWYEFNFKLLKYKIIMYMQKILYYLLNCNFMLMIKDYINIIVYLLFYLIFNLIDITVHSLDINFHLLSYLLNLLNCNFTLIIKDYINIIVYLLFYLIFNLIDITVHSLDINFHLLSYLIDVIVKYIYKTVDSVKSLKNYLKLITHFIYATYFFFKNKFKVIYFKSKQFIFDLFINIIFFLHIVSLYIYFYFIKKIMIDLNWYIKIILQIYIFFIDPIKLIILFKCYIYIFIINLNFINNLNNWLLIKVYFFKYFFNYIKLLLNIRNTLVYFKSNYYLFRKQRSSWGDEDILYKTALVNTVTIRNIKFFKHFTHNMVFLKNIYLFNFTNYLYLINKVNINIQFLPLIQIIKYNFVYYYLIIYIFIYILFILFFFIYYKKFYNFLFFCKKANIDAQFYWKNYFDKKSIDLSKHYSNKKNKFRKKIWKWKNWFNFYNFIILNSLKTTYTNKNLIKIFFISKFYNNFRKLFNQNKLVYFNKKIFMSYNFFFNKYFDFVKNISMEKVPIKKEKKTYMFSFLNAVNINLLNFCFFYWFLVIPYFFFEYVWIRFSMRGHTRLKRKYIILFKLFFDSFRWYVKIFKVLGHHGYFKHKHKAPRSYLGTYSSYRKKKRFRFGGYFKWDRYHRFYIRLSPMGNYYYWFRSINRYHYYFYNNKQILNIFNFAFKSFYFFYIYIYIFFLIILYKIYKNKFYN